MRARTCARGSAGEEVRARKCARGSAREHVARRLRVFVQASKCVTKRRLKQGQGNSVIIFLFTVEMVPLGSILIVHGAAQASWCKL